MYPLLVVAAKTSIDKQNKNLLLKVKLVNQNISYKRFLVYHVPPSCTCTCMLVFYHRYMYIRCLDGITECVVAQFHEAAEELIREKGATSAMATALAYIAGAKDIVSR